MGLPRLMRCLFQQTLVTFKTQIFSLDNPLKSTVTCTIHKKKAAHFPVSTAKEYVNEKKNGSYIRIVCFRAFLLFETALANRKSMFH